VIGPFETIEKNLKIGQKIKIQSNDFHYGASALLTSGRKNIATVFWSVAWSFSKSLTARVGLQKKTCVYNCCWTRLTSDSNHLRFTAVGLN